MRNLTAALRTWPMLAALGAGLMSLAIAAGLPAGAAIAPAGLGLAAIGWAALALRAGRLLAPRVVLAVTAIALFAPALLMAIGVLPPVGLLPMLAAALFLLVVAVAAAIELRRRPADAGARRAAGQGVTIAGLAIGALLMAGIATPALAATEVGGHAVPHVHSLPGGHEH